MSYIRSVWCDNVAPVAPVATPLSSMVDDNDSEADIAQCFGRKYESLYTSVSYDPQEMDNLKEEIDASVFHHSNGDCLSHLLTVHDLTLAVKGLKQGKHDGHNGLLLRSSAPRAAAIFKLPSPYSERPACTRHRS